jgi:hypothetical protein
MNISPPFLSTFLEEKNLKTVYDIDPVYSIDWRWYIIIYIVWAINTESLHIMKTKKTTPYSKIIIPRFDINYHSIIKWSIDVS